MCSPNSDEKRNELTDLISDKGSSSTSQTIQIASRSVIRVEVKLRTGDIKSRNVLQ